MCTKRKLKTGIKKIHKINMKKKFYLDKNVRFNRLINNLSLKNNNILSIL